ncbi:MAG: FAD-dependent oxidoreductase [Prevotellaceae bacterium]|nr:FAD-dependent oxidoreductase [Prevotellaceae bacterium]
MDKRLYSLFIVTFLSILLFSCNVTTAPCRIDLLIIGGGASGTAAGVQAARMGCPTLVVEETPWLGGMLTAAGVSATDGNYQLPGGIWGEFRDSLANYYGGLDSLKTGWVSYVLFEPSVGNRIFTRMAVHEENLTVWLESSLVSLERQQDKWLATIRTGDVLKHVVATIVIDATELGDVAKRCGVKYDIGMESRDDTKEPIAPAQANDIVQDLTYVAVLKDYGRDVTIARPAGYDSSVFACACDNPVCITPKEPDRLWRLQEMITYGKLPNNKYMINWPIEGNDYYVNVIEMTPDERKAALQDAKQFTLKFLYFIQHELGLNTLGLADDEYPTADRLPFIPYYRESRRIEGIVRFTLPYITDPYMQELPLYRTGIAVGDYPVDHHHARYEGSESLPDLHFSPIPSYSVPLGALIPAEVKGLVVAEKAISVSNIVNGTTRLQPVVLQIGQAAGALAALAIQQQTEVEQVAVRDVQNALLAANGYLMPFLDVPVTHPLFKVYQRIGASGILQGKGQSIGWSNQTWLRVDEPLLAAELSGLKDIYPQASLAGLPTVMTLHSALALICDIARLENSAIEGDMIEAAQKVYANYALGAFQPEAPITRGVFAVLVDVFLDPFNRKNVDLYGNIIKTNEQVNDLTIQ